MEHITIREIAKKTGVSIATVSRAINPHTTRLVKKSTRIKVLAVVKKTGYLPSPVAKRLATGKSTNIVIFLGTKYKSIFYNDYYIKILSGAMEVLEHTQYNLVIRLVKPREARFDLNKVIRGMDIAGCIIFNEPDVLQVSMPGLENVGIPVVVLNRAEKKEGAGFMACDNYRGAYDATKHLIELGHTRIAIIKGCSEEKDFIDRFEGYKNAMINSSLPLDEQYMYTGYFSQDTGVKALREFMKLQERPTSIFCTNDEIAIGVFMALEEVGLKCPGDISIMGFDGLDVGRYLVPKLTTMRQPIYEMAKEAMKDILDTLDNKKTMGTRKIFDAHLVKGGTCAKPNPSPACVRT